MLSSAKAMPEKLTGYMFIYREVVAEGKETGCNKQNINLKS